MSRAKDLLGNFIIHGIAILPLLFIIISNQFFEPEITSTVTYTQNSNDSGSELDKILQHNEMRLERES